jgi:hypothetical protein
MDTQPVADVTVAAADVVAATVAAADVVAAAVAAATDKTIDETKTSGGDPMQDVTAETTDVCVDPKTVVPKELEATSVVEAITARSDATGDPQEAEKPATVIVDVDRMANDVIDVEEDPVVNEQKATTEDSVAPKEDPPANEPEEATNDVVVPKEDQEETANDVINPEEQEAVPLLGLGLLEEPEASQAPLENKENHGVDAVFSSPIGRLADDDADHALLNVSATETEEDSIIRSMISSPPPIKKRSSPEPKIEDEPDMKKISAEGLAGPQENAWEGIH